MNPGAKVLLVSALASGQGKTTVTAALARKLVHAGQRVRVFKTGPDFLDPMMLARASRAPVYNLDLWIVGLEQCRALLAAAAAEADVVLIEGVMGLYDGNPSSADLARAFGVPVLAVLDASAMAQTAGAVVLGLRDYGPVQLAGVVANRVAGAGHADMVRQALREVPLVATLERQSAGLPERHLGLLQPEEIDGIEQLLDQWAESLVLDGEILERMAPAQFAPADAVEAAPQRLLEGKVIAVARDRAFAFIHPANLDCLRALGADLVFFSPLADEAVPEHADAVYLPGGYPELHGAVLGAATRWQASMRAFHAAGRPVYAECGGLMALAQSLRDKHGAQWPMAGLLPGEVVMQQRLTAIGSQAWHTRCGALRGHTFHYSRFDTSLVPHAQAIRHPSGQAGEAVFRLNSLVASYFHAYFPSCPAAVAQLFRGDPPMAEEGVAQ